MKNIFRTTFLCISFVALYSVSAFSQCPMCKAAVESQTGDGATALQENLNTGILYLMVLPYLCLMFVGFLSWRYIKKAKAADHAASHAG